jgi:hypothetical protein
MSKKIYATLILIVLCVNLSLAEKVKKEKFGKISPEEWALIKYDRDTSADAVVLYQYAEFNPNNFTYRYHERIKVLKKTGTGNANMAFYGRVKQNIKASSYNMEDGKMVVSKLSKESVYEERVVGSFYRTRIALPNVKVGSIIEVEYSMPGLPPSLEIQRYIPVVYSAAIFPKHPNVDYSIKEIGALGAVFATSDTWIYKDIPAFVGEPYLISDRDYRVRMEFEITSYNFSNQYYSSMGFFASSWSAVTKVFYDHEYFGKKYRDFNFHLNSLADDIKKMSGNEEALVKNAYEAMMSIKWNGQEACYVSQEMSQTYQLKSGNSADINLTLLSLLKKLGLKAYPVLFSTRSNGRISKYTPTINKFNYVIVGVDLSTGPIYLDATEEFAPYYLLPSRVMGCLGHPVEDGKPACSVQISPTKNDKKTTNSMLTIDPEGKISGKIKIQREDYNAIDFKRFLKSKTDHDTYIQELESYSSGWYIEKYSFENLNDPYLPFINEYDVTYSSAITGAEMITIDPFAFVKPTYNPFVKETRRFPISYPQPFEHSYMVTISIPENYKFAETPKNVELLNRDKTMKFTYQVTRIGSSVTIKASYSVSRLQYETVDYISIRDLFDKMLQKFNESVIIKKV